MKRMFSSHNLVKATLIAGFLVGCNQAPVRKQSPSPVSVPLAVAPPPKLERPISMAQAPEPTPAPEAPKAVVTSFARGPQQSDRKSFVDTTAQPGFAHAPDYSWLTG